MTATYIVTKFDYNESADAIEAVFYQADKNGVEQERDAFVYVVHHQYGEKSSIEFIGKAFDEASSLFLPQLMLAYLEAFDEAHAAQNSSSPAETVLESFTAEF